ncbi:hypothetical protein PF007_g32214 [Phytophthora fragariae]|uniref:Uncharacterized protein n=1 Tax=Phytophthora fragariae TaxID=53985 RepID=A0A6A3D6M2_9STRA|nr:hypothetical protein PF009_g32627 [Phytophthora fragariae]KAE9055742.1 hypothetical protein PF007_g32214 [Phytophthora fragariae]
MGTAPSRSSATSALIHVTSCCSARNSSEASPNTSTDDGVTGVAEASPVSTSVGSVAYSNSSSSSSSSSGSLSLSLLPSKSGPATSGSGMVSDGSPTEDGTPFSSERSGFRRSTIVKAFTLSIGNRDKPSACPIVVPGLW